MTPHVTVLPSTETISNSYALIGLSNNIITAIISLRLILLFF